MDNKKKKYRKEYYEKNKSKLIDYGKRYYNDRNNPTVIITITRGHFSLYFDWVLFFLTYYIIVCIV